MKSREYWKRRFELLEEASNRKAVMLLEETERQFRAAQKEIEDEIAAWYARFAQNNDISIKEARKWLQDDELEEFRWTVEQYIAHGQGAAKNPAWKKQLENASVKFHISRLEALKLQIQNSLESLYGNHLDAVDDLAKRLYLDGYYRSIFEIQKGVGVGWDIAAVDERTLSRVLKKPWTTDGRTFSDRIWQNKEKLVNELHAQVTQGVLLGKSPDAAIKNIAKTMGVSRYNAGTLVMTESAYFSSLSQKDAFESLDVERFEVVETLDGKTCAECGDMDGKVFDMRDFEPGVTAPPFHPRCRGCTAPYFEDDDGERIARGANGKTYTVPANTKYNDWKKQHVVSVDKSAKSGILVARAEDAVIPEEKFTQYALNPLKQPDKARAFREALGYGLEDAGELMDNIRANLTEFPAKLKASDQYGKRYEIVMRLIGKDGKAASVKTAWLTDKETGAFRLISAYVAKKKGR